MTSACKFEMSCDMTLYFISFGINSKKKKKNNNNSKNKGKGKQLGLVYFWHFSFGVIIYLNSRRLV